MQPQPDRAIESQNRRRHTAEQALLVRFAEPTGADGVPLVGTEYPAPLARVPDELSRPSRVVPAELAGSAGLPGDTTVGHAAAALLLAVKGAAGPRCPSARAAGYDRRALERGRPIALDNGEDYR
jgi:hypothetical protein